MITRAPRPKSNFYLLDKSISEDKRLSWAARGVLIFLLGKPDQWVVSPAALVNETAKAYRSTGRDGIYSALKELKDSGYLRTIGNRNDGGTFAGADYVVSESPHTENPDAVDLPDTVNPDAVPPVAPHTPLPDTANPTQVSIEGKQGLNGDKGLNSAAAPANATPATSEKAATHKEPPVVLIPLVDGTEFEVTRAQYEEWVEAFPAADVQQQLRNMRQWCIANSARRKTRRGVLAFIANWLTKEQDKGGSHTQSFTPRQTTTDRRTSTMDGLTGRNKPKDQHDIIEAESHLI